MKGYIQKLMDRKGIAVDDLNCVQRVMLERDLNPQEVADMSGVSYTTIGGIATGDTAIGKVRIDNFLKIAHAFGMTADELFDGERREYDDPMQADLNAAYGRMNARGRMRLADVAEDISSNPANLTGGNGSGSQAGRTA